MQCMFTINFIATNCESEIPTGGERRRGHATQLIARHDTAIINIFVLDTF